MGLSMERKFVKQRLGVPVLGLGVIGAGSRAWASGAPAVDLEDIVVAARRAQLIGQVESASRGTVLKARRHAGLAIGFPYA